MNSVSLKLTYASLFILALATFTSVSIAALSHILLVVPGLYFTYLYFKEERDLKVLSASFWLLLALLIVIVLSVAVNTDILEAPLKKIAKGKYFLMGLLGVFAYRRFFNEWENKNKAIKVLLNTFLIATTVASLAGIIGLYTGYTPIKFKQSCHATRACGLFGMYMTYGYGISMFMILISGLLLYRDQVRHLVSEKLLWISWIVNLAGLFLSYTRGGWLAFLLAVPFFFFKKNKKAFLTVVGASAIVFGATFLFVPKVKKMFLNRGGSNQMRLAFFETAYRAFQEKPVLGWGYKNFEPNVQKLKAKHNIAFAGVGGHAHNNFLEHLASTGILGFVVVILFHLAWLREMYVRDDLIAILMFPFVLNFIISGMFQYTFGDGENLFLLMGVYALSQLQNFKPRLSS